MKSARLIVLIAFFSVVTGGAVCAQGIPPSVVFVTFDVQPSDTPVGEIMSPNVVVRVMGGANSPLAGVSLKLSLDPNPYNTKLWGGTLAGVTGTDGNAMFYPLRFSRPGQDLRLSVLAAVPGSGMVLGSSEPFNVMGQGPSVDPIGPLTTAIYTLRLPANVCHPNPDIPVCAGEYGDTMPPGPNLIYFSFGFFDTGSTVAFINNYAPSPYLSDANLLDLCSWTDDCPEPPGGLLPNLDMRVWGLEAVDPGSLGADLDTPEAEVFGIQVRPHGGPTLIGAPISSQIVAYINYARTVSRTFSWGTYTSPDIEFFQPDDVSIPSPLYEVELERRGSSGTALDGASTGPRYLAKQAAFENDGLTADDSSFGFLVDTANTTSQINENVAVALGINTASDPPYDVQVINTLQGELTVKGYLVDSFELLSDDGTWKFLLYNPLVYVVPPRDPPNDLPAQTFFVGIDVILGSNYFENRKILFDGPRDRLGLFWGVRIDEDNDGVANVDDNCPLIPNPGQADEDDDGLGDACDPCPLDGLNDIDGDGVCGDTDNCPDVANAGQGDDDGDTLGDACDPCPFDALNDVDGDGVCADTDNCPGISNPGQVDDDGDTIGNVCDPCPFDTLNDIDGDGLCGDVDNCPDDANPGQDDNDGDGIGDVCDPDDDNDGVDDATDTCPLEPNPDNLDGDGDLIGDVCDPCPATPLNDVCNPDNSAGESVGSGGGSVTTPNGYVKIDIPEAALDTETSISVTDSGEGANIMLLADIGGGAAFFQVTINPEGAVFNVPVTITLGWPDDNNDGFIDGLDPAVDELDLRVLKDGVAITGECRDDARCDPVLNTFSVEVMGFSDFALFVLDCPDFLAPEGQGYWHRQCKGWDTRRFNPTEPGFEDELVPCANRWLETLGFPATTTCDGMEAWPANDECEKALKKLTSMTLNVCSDRLGAGCLVDATESGCSSVTVGLLMEEIAQLISNGDCKKAKVCASVFD